MSSEKHKSTAPKSLNYGIITISDSCYKGVAEDRSGKYIAEKLSENNKVLKTVIVPDEKELIEKAVFDMLSDVESIVTTGGTGITKRDVTIQTIKPYFDKEIPGFGEIFRYLSYKEIGFPGIISGAIAGTIREKIIFCLPGSLNAVKLGTDIIVSEAAHMIKHLRD
ncbi:MAG: MogA/MoaB family molybdenum cofactor biosynthesis protein [Candidatus Methanofastidiosa archaeon]|jgi:molybdenum cofactor biosynthesis protein B|nr:MogA/MoaB family molybdenum cofactor biosynthesis protein [Candidatus Methanofastidiosa archaeon]